MFGLAGGSASDSPAKKTVMALKNAASFMNLILWQKRKRTTKFLN